MCLWERDWGKEKTASMFHLWWGWREAEAEFTCFTTTKMFRISLKIWESSLHQKKTSGFQLRLSARQFTVCRLVDYIQPTFDFALPLTHTLIETSAICSLTRSPPSQRTTAAERGDLEIHLKLPLTQTHLFKNVFNSLCNVCEQLITEITWKHGRLCGCGHEWIRGTRVGGLPCFWVCVHVAEPRGFEDTEEETILKTWPWPHFMNWALIRQGVGGLRINEWQSWQNKHEQLNVNPKNKIMWWPWSANHKS